MPAIFSFVQIALLPVQDMTGPEIGFSGRRSLFGSALHVASFGVFGDQ
jgi:hypothetical protein